MVDLFQNQTTDRRKRWVRRAPLISSASNVLPRHPNSMVTKNLIFASKSDQKETLEELNRKFRRFLSEATKEPWYRLDQT